MGAPSRLRRGPLAALGLTLCLGLILLGCSLILAFDPEQLLENNADRCSDGVDNDDNGLTDCAEPDCAVFDFCAEVSEQACRDRMDNNRNGLIDCEDPGCLDYAPCTELPDGQCHDGLDNNDNGLVDCQDFTCGAEPGCCSLVAPLLSDSLFPAAGGCVPNVCDPDQSGASCQAFDSTRWVSVGAPAPAALAGGGLDPNRCDDCYAQGDCAPCADALLLSVMSFVYRPGLLVGAVLHQSAGEGARAGLALTWQTSFPEGIGCVGDAVVDRIAAVELTRDGSGESIVTFLVDGSPEASQPWPSDSLAAFVLMDSEGFARFYLADTLDDLPLMDSPAAHRSNRPLPQSSAPVRLALYGGGSGLRVSRVGAWDAARCPDPVPSHVSSEGGGVAFPAGGEGAWDGAMVESPTVVDFAGERHMYYVGRNDAQGGLGALGHAVQQGDSTGLVWVRDSVEAPLLTAEDLYSWPAGTAELYGPSALVLPDGRLALYFTVARREGDSVGWTGIDGVVSSDGVTFERMVSGSDEDVLLAPVTQQQASSSWERVVRDPAVVWRLVDGTPRFTMLYTGRSDPENPFTAQLGLASSEDGVFWQRDNLVDPCPEDGCNRPVVTPPADALVHTAVSDPTLVWDPLLQIFRLWYVWRVGQRFSIFHAVAAGDARHWVVYPGNPVLRSGDLQWCDDLYLDGPSALMDPSGRLSFWYHGHSLTYGHSICYAENSFFR